MVLSKLKTAAWSAPSDSVADTAEMALASPIVRADPIIGTPLSDATTWAGQQEHSDTCAIRCQEFIITQFTGRDPGENSLVKEAADHGWYGSGTALPDVGRLLESHGIPVNRYQHANIFNLSNELAQGHKVIVVVHGDALWRQTPLLTDLFERLGLNRADHAVVVSGIDTSDPEHVSVIVSDPGTGQPVAHYPVEQFVDAWKDSDFYMVSTQDPPPASAHLPEMANFDYAKGHVDHMDWVFPGQTIFRPDSFTLVPVSLSGVDEYLGVNSSPCHMQSMTEHEAERYDRNIPDTEYALFDFNDNF